jgi:hypothetical protein
LDEISLCFSPTIGAVTEADVCGAGLSGSLLISNHVAQASFEDPSGAGLGTNSSLDAGTETPVRGSIAMLGDDSNVLGESNKSAQASLEELVGLGTGSSLDAEIEASSGCVLASIGS